MKEYAQLNDYYVVVKEFLNIFSVGSSHKGFQREVRIIDEESQVEVCHARCVVHLCFEVDIMRRSWCDFEV
jgi:hypothetical protein